MKTRRLITTSLGLSLWLVASVAGLVGLWRYSAVAGRSGEAPTLWPAESLLTRSPDRCTLVLFVHPQCPCSRATLGELAVLMARGGDRVSASVVFHQPEGADDAWTQSDLWRSAAAIPGVRVVADPTGREAHRFHAATSGETQCFDAQGRLRFQGGITGVRGHAGDNAGRSALETLLFEGHADATETPVFGCGLFNPDTAESTLVWRRP